jgi:hypothetical protein
MKNLFLKRAFLGEDYTIGHLFIGEEYFCDTLEDKVRDLNKDGDLDDPGEEKVPSFTAVPYGRYRVIIARSLKFKRNTPKLLDVNNFTDILIHTGNTAADSSGCILVGENKVKGALVRSTAAFLRLMEVLNEFVAQNEDIYINVT